MPSDYLEISRQNVVRYGTDINEYGPKLLADRYADRTHFIYELLQNTEDALRRRGGGINDGAARFTLTRNALEVRHRGKPFDAGDVDAVCSIGRSTKDATAIGRFGIGFKSVYTVTDRPEIHSGDEHFAIEWFVRPVAVSSNAAGDGATLIILPLKTESHIYGEIVQGLKRLGPDALLFLRYITEIHWEAEEGASGLYMRSPPTILGPGVERITVLGQEVGEEDFEESWLVFRRAARNAVGTDVGNIEVAFCVEQDADTERWTLCAIANSPLVVFFPTVLETHLGFMVQGPYSTTPSRDNAIQGDPWNQHLVQETAALILEALDWLRTHEMLDVDALSCLPLKADRFTSKNMFAPVFHVVRDALSKKALLPCINGIHAAASNAKLGRTAELRDLLSPEQLGKLYGAAEIHWLSGDITPDRASDVYTYLRQELGVVEITPDTLVSKLDAAFLAEQSDAWMMRLYEFLLGQPRLQGRLETIPLIRLDDGAQVVARRKGQPQAFLPSGTATGFPTVRRAVCATEAAEKFLRTMGITEPDPVDDVVQHVLPKYHGEKIGVTRTEYAIHIDQILAAFETDSTAQRDKLKSALERTNFVRVVDAGTGKAYYTRPTNAYIATERLAKLFDGVDGVYLVNQSDETLRGEPIRDVLTQCGASRYLQTIQEQTTLDPDEARRLRKQAGWEQSSGHESTQDYSLRGLRGVLKLMAKLPIDKQRDRALTLWQALCDLAERSMSPFSAKYSWFYMAQRSASLDAKFVRLLRSSAWVPNAQGELDRPEFVVFETLGWPSHNAVEHRLQFKAAIIESLALEAGVDPEVIDLIKRLGLTPEAIMAKFGANNPLLPPPSSGDTPMEVPRDQVRDVGPSEIPGSRGANHASTSMGGPSGGGGGKEPMPPARSNTSREFVSYIATHMDDPDDDPADQPGSDGYQRKMALEAAAIAAIVEREPRLRRTVEGNAGYDLYEEDDLGAAMRWVEVKALRGAWQGRDAGMSSEQFRQAQIRKNAYWLYVIEFAGDPTQMKIHRLPNPAGQASYFTFDSGWAQVAQALTDSTTPSL